MSQQTVAVVGASGFVGSTFLERVLHDSAARIVPLIHSTGNAARLSRLGVEFRMVDLLSPSSLDEALEGCSHVVNCSRGNTAVMIQGLQNLLDRSRAAGVRRFVHLSSVAVYGDTPPGQVVENAEPRPAARTYGATKLLQDQMVKAAVGQGLPAVVLCPPNISGPYSPFLVEITQTLRSGQFGLVEDGALPCELVDVENLVHGMRLALTPEARADGERLFVTDCASTTWRDIVDALMDMADPPAVVPLGRDAATRLAATPRQPVRSIRRTFLHLLSSDVRDALRKDPVLARMELLAKSAVRSLPGAVATAAQRRVQATDRRPRPATPTARVSIPLVRQQLRDVRYSGARIREALGYVPVVTFDDSMQAFRGWYRDVTGWDTESWPLLRQLYS